MREVRYRFEVGSLEGLVQQLAQSLLPNGYHFYVMGHVPERKDPRAVDRKLITRYGVAVSKYTRYRRKEAGLPNLAYLRLDQTFLLLGTLGRGHRFFDEERANIRDVTRIPIKVGGYAVGFRRGRASVRIERETFKLIKGEFEALALTGSAEDLEAALLALPFEPYKPVRRQLFELVRKINRRRKLAGLPLVSGSAVRWHRQIYQPYRPAALAFMLDAEQSEGEKGSIQPSTNDRAMAEPARDKSNPITTLVLEEADGGFGLKIPEFDIELYGEDLPELIEQAEDRLWGELERYGEAVPETATLAIRRVTKEEFGPTCFELQAEREDWGEEA